MYKKQLIIAGVGLVLGVSAYAATLRLKNFFEIQNSMEAATNVPSARTEISLFYKKHWGQLPKHGELSELTAQSEIASVGLGALYCAKMIEKDSQMATTALRWSHHQVDFSLVPAQGLLTDAILNDVLQDYATLFWQRSILVDEQASLKTFAQEMSQQFPTEAGSTPKILLSLCSVFSGSFSALSF